MTAVWRSTLLYTPVVRSNILSKLIFASCVWYSDRAYYGLCVLIKDIGRRLPLQLQCSNQGQQGDVRQSVRGNCKTCSWGRQNLTAVEGNASVYQVNPVSRIVVQYYVIITDTKDGKSACGARFLPSFAFWTLGITAVMLFSSPLVARALFLLALVVNVSWLYFLRGSRYVRMYLESNIYAAARFTVCQMQPQ